MNDMTELERSIAQFETDKETLGIYYVRKQHASYGSPECYLAMVGNDQTLACYDNRQMAVERIEKATGVPYERVEAARENYLADLFQYRKLTHDEDVELRRLTALRNGLDVYFYTADGSSMQIDKKGIATMMDSPIAWPWEADNERMTVYSLKCASSGAPNLKDHVAALRQDVESQETES